MQQPDGAQSNDLTTAELLNLLGDEYTRRVYEAIAEQPRSGREAAEAANVSRPTVYRRLNKLRDAGLVRTEMIISEKGHHRERFEAVSTTLSVSMGEDGMNVKVGTAD